MAGESKLTRNDLTFPGNSISKPPINTIIEKPKFKPIVKATELKRNGGFLTKIKSSLISSFDTKSMGEYLVFDIIIPAIKSSIFDASMSALKMIFYGDKKNAPNNVYRDGGRSYVSYTSFYNDNRPLNMNRQVPMQNRYNFDDTIFTDQNGKSGRINAEEVLAGLCDAVEKYGLVSVADFFDLCGIDHPYTDGDYGWSNLSDAYVERVRDGYIVKLPRPRPLK